jgi:Tetratricopeptide repeat
VAGALRLYEELLPAVRRVLGADHPDTLSARKQIAGFTAHTGDVAGALRLYGELLSDQARVLGADHPDTLLTRSVIASLTGNMRNPGKPMPVGCSCGCSSLAAVFIAVVACCSVFFLL